MATPEEHYISDYLQLSLDTLTHLTEDGRLGALLICLADDVSAAFQTGGKLLVAGNGGSASLAQHIVAEFVTRVFFDRAPLPAIALSADTSVLTAASNDYGYEHVFARQVASLGRKGDVLLVLSTSGNSPNVLKALDAARELGMATLGFTGASGGDMSSRCDLILKAPSENTAQIQQVHLVAAHLLCGLVERRMFEPPSSLGLTTRF